MDRYSFWQTVGEQFADTFDAPRLDTVTRRGVVHVGGEALPYLPANVPAHELVSA